MKITVTVNATDYTRVVEPRLLLIHFLRDDLGLTGSHWGCDTSNCGACVVWLLMAKFGKISSLAALAAFAAAPVLAAVFDKVEMLELGVVIAVLVFIRHHANIRRLIAGTEPRIGQGKAEPA